MGAASRCRDRPALLATRFNETERFCLHDGNVGITAESPQLTLNALGAGEAPIEERYALDTAASNAEMAGHWINSAQREGFKRGLDAEAPRLQREPLRRCIVD